MSERRTGAYKLIGLDDAQAAKMACEPSTIRVEMSQGVFFPIGDHEIDYWQRRASEIVTQK